MRVALERLTPCCPGCGSHLSQPFMKTPITDFVNAMCVIDECELLYVMAQFWRPQGELNIVKNYWGQK